jgi:hypothetical protein
MMLIIALQKCILNIARLNVNNYTYSYFQPMHQFGPNVLPGDIVYFVPSLNWGSNNSPDDQVLPNSRCSMLHYSGCSLYL